MLFTGNFLLKLILFIYQFLLSLNVLKHIFAFGEDYKVREDLRIFVVKTA